MTHATGNATWQDYPAGVTKITATRLENIENSADALYGSEYGTSRTSRVLLRAYYNSSYTQTSADIFAAGSWPTASDNAGGWTLSSPSYYTIPISGRLWELSFKTNAGLLPFNAVLVCRICLNAANISQSIASDATVGANTGGEGEINANSPAYPLNAGDKLYLVVWCSTSVTVGTIFGNVVPEFVVRDVGPS